MSNIPLPGQVYRHFKGNLYRIVTLAQHSETEKNLVIYQALYGEYKVYARELSMFMDKLDGESYPEAAGSPRFELQKELIEAPVIHSADAEKAVEENYVEEAAVQDTLSEISSENREAEELSEYRKTEALSEGRESEEAETKEQQEELNIDPLVLDFLDARTYRERLKILSELHPRITDDMINIMAISSDVEIKDGDTEKRFEELRTCL